MLNFLRYSIKLLLILVTGVFATHSLLPPVLPHSSHPGPVAGGLKSRKEPEEEELMDRKRAEVETLRSSLHLEMERGKRFSAE